MKFKYWLEMAWVVNNSRQEYESLKRQVALDPSIMGERTSLSGGGKGIINWEMAAQYYMKELGENNISPKEFVLKHQKSVFARVDPCVIVNMRMDYSTISGEEHYEKLFKDSDVDPGLVIIMVPPNVKSKPYIYDGNHRLMAACKQNQDAFAAFIYWFDINNYPIYKSIKEILG